ncbi:MULTISPECIES: hypothetical protein [Candidatus Cardinium]|uniref:hypothetical protein n=1 Tax=Candidatus Cardinium TaxID=273135 RepID=UPI001FA9C879|nr:MULTISPECIES: hypothetical protein [Cardinium]
MQYLDQNDYSIESIKYLWERSLYKNATDHNGCDILHLITRSKQADLHQKTATFLIEAGVNTNSKWLIHLILIT